ncbi:MAG: DotU family type IV/VI secretion system protein [Desulfovibrio sp.]|uniref:DotU family type IV/VI secretion system protein n=1 Tax=Desulfovibrio sp. 7SRBS1 TaxID=3378064 RepID=UPI003B3FAAE1
MALVDCFTRVLAYVQVVAAGKAPGEVTYETVRKDLETLFASSEDRAVALGVQRELFRRAEFAVCCWIDETLLAVDWSGREEWLKRPLQRAQFNTINGGEEFFSRLDEAQNREEMELVEVFHACISLGFTGRYYQENQKALLDEISLAQAKRLYGPLAASIAEQAGDEVAEPLFPDAYGQDTAPGKRPLMAYRFLDPGVLAMLVVPAMAVLGLFFYYRHELNRLLEQMLKAV